MAGSGADQGVGSAAAENRTDPDRTPALFWPLVYTLLALLATAGAVSGIMYFLVCYLQVPLSFWLVPLFGSIGGLVGGLLRAEGLLLMRVEFSAAAASRPSFAKINAGIVADVITGLAGAAAAIFLFGGTLNLQFQEKPDAQAHQSYPVLIGVSLIAGVFGERIIRAAGKTLLEQAKDVAEEKAREVVQEEIKEASALAYNQAAEQNIRNGVELEAALKWADRAISIDPSLHSAYVTKGRALKRLGRVDDAVAVLDEVLRLKPDYAYALYNRACYKLALGGQLEDVMRDLRQAVAAVPRLANNARADADLASISRQAVFVELLRSAGVEVPPERG